MGNKKNLTETFTKENREQSLLEIVPDPIWTKKYRL